jgi:hypothetical protein
MPRRRQRGGSTRQSKGKGKGPKVAITRSESERSVSSSQFIRLDDDEKFVGNALFDPDPAKEDNDGYVEYGEHWDQQGGRFVPCWGIKNGCIFCKAGMNPSQRALAAFLVTSIDGEDLDEPEIKLFRMNWTMIQEWGDTLDEDGSTLGQKVRIKCQSRSDGDFITKFFEKDRLTKKDIKAALKDVPDIEQTLQNNLDRSLEALRVADALESDDEDEDDEDIDDEEAEDESDDEDENDSDDDDSDDDDEDDDEEDDDDDDDDEEEEEKPKRGRGRPKGSRNKKKKDEEEDEDEESDDDDEDEDDEDDEDESDEDDEDEDDEDSDDEDEARLEGEFTIKSVNESELTFTLKEVDSDVYFDQKIAKDLDWEDYSKGDKVNIVAGQDEDDDWVITSLEKVEKKAKGGRRKKK